jgi:general secretion pathway protein G
MSSATESSIAIADRSGRERAVAACQAGFTLIEMLVVLAIIGLLVGLVAPRVFNQLAEAKVRTAHIQIESLKNSLDLFSFDAGRYPTTSEGLAALTARPSDVANWHGPYIQAVPRDPWNNPYAYRSPGDDGRQYEIVSFGPGGKDGRGAGSPQIASWQGDEARQ